jgi:hypothetical protein
MGRFNCATGDSWHWEPADDMDDTPAHWQPEGNQLHSSANSLFHKICNR